MSVKQIQKIERMQLFEQNVMLLCYNISQFIFHCQDVEFQFWQTHKKKVIISCKQKKTKKKSWMNWKFIWNDKLMDVRIWNDCATCVLIETMFWINTFSHTVVSDDEFLCIPNDQLRCSGFLHK